MGLSHDVRLPKAVTPIYPDCCVVCQQPHPGSFLGITTISSSWWDWISPSIGRVFRARFPACEACALRFRSQRRRRLVVMWTCILVDAAVAIYLLRAYRGPLRVWVQAGVALVLFLPYIIWAVLHAPAVGVTAHPDEVEYEFSNSSYAYEFARLNGARVT